MFVEVIILTQHRMEEDSDFTSPDLESGKEGEEEENDEPPAKKAKTEE